MQNYDYFRRYDDNRLRFSLLITPKSGGRFARMRIKTCDIAEAKLFLTLAMHLYDLAKMENLNPPSKFDGVSKEFRRLMRDVCYLNQCRISLFGIAYRQ